jgi:hypothetical protein
VVADIFDDSGEYVCISHVQISPCLVDGYHLLSNWPPDVAKVLDTIEKSQ